MTYDQLMRWREAVGAMPASNDEYISGVRDAGNALAERIEKLEGLVYVPGLWRCAKCNFQLQQMNLHASTGTVSARNEPGDKCPNCDAPLWRVTEREAGNQMCDRLEAEIVGRIAMLDHLEATAEVSEKRIADVYDLIYKTRELIRARLQPGSEEFRPEFKMLQDAIYGLGGRVNVTGTIRAAREHGSTPVTHDEDGAR